MKVNLNMANDILRSGETPFVARRVYWRDRSARSELQRVLRYIHEIVCL